MAEPNPQFEKWAGQHDFWKSGTKDAMREIWDQLWIMGAHQHAIADILDRAVLAMRAEYGE